MINDPWLIINYQLLIIRGLNRWVGFTTVDTKLITKHGKRCNIDVMLNG